MKTCPSCSRKYEDDTMMFCLQDGAGLISDSRNDQATWHLPQPPVTEPPRAATIPPTAVSPPATITARPDQFRPAPQQFQQSQNYAEAPSRRSALPWVLAIVLVLGVSGVLIAWIMTRGGGKESRTATNVATPTPRDETATSVSTPEVIPTPKPSATQAIANDSPKIEKPKPTPTAERAKPAFSILNNTSYSGGSRITYYPRASVGGCQADCAANGSCRAFTWIRPGAYNPGDSAMCYLMYSVTGPVSHPCCISGVKN
jgi:PAN domain